MKHRRIIAYLIGLGSLVSAILVLTAPNLPAWGVRHDPHPGEPYLRLRQDESIAQTFEFEQSQLDAVLLWLEPSASNLHKNSELTISYGSVSQTSKALVVAPDGLLVFQFEHPISAGTGTAAQMTLKNRDPAPIYVRYQIDSTKFSQGELEYKPNTRKVGDVAFQLRYQRPALGTTSIQVGYALAIAIMGIIAAAIIWRSKADKHKWKIKNIRIPAAIAIVISMFYLALLIHPGFWIGPSDFAKDVSYVKSSTQAIEAGRYPAWTHTMCGGLGLLSNPEGNTLSATTLFGLVTDPEHAIWIVLALEAGIAAAGSYVLARTLKIPPLPSVLAGVIVGLSPTYIYKLAEGFSMLGGIFALAPWVYLAYIKAARGALWPWAPIGGLALIGIFWRGDVHAVIGLVAALIVWALITAWQKRSYKPLLPLVLMGCISLLGGSVKILPYLEQAELVSPNIDPHVVLLTEQRLWDDILLKVPPRSTKIKVEHGLPEHFGYIGGYIGIIPILLAIAGIFYTRRYRWHLIGALIAIIILIDGTLYNEVLNQAGILRALLRMPSRLIITMLPLLAVAAAAGLHAVQKKSKKNWLAIAILLFVILDLGRASISVANSSFSEYSNRIAPIPETPTLAVHKNDTTEDRHSSQLLGAGYMLPRMCGDWTNPPQFLSQIEGFTPLTDHSAQIGPNEIHVHDTNDESVQIRERFVSSWVSSQGISTPAEAGNIRVIRPPDDKDITLTYLLATTNAQKAILLTVVISVVWGVASPGNIRALRKIRKTRVS